MIEYFEFLALYRAIESKTDEEKAIRKIFSEECDLIVSNTEEKALSLDKFVFLAINYNFFNKQAVEKFIINVSKTVGFLKKFFEFCGFFRIKSKVLKTWKKIGLREKT